MDRPRGEDSDTLLGVLYAGLDSSKINRSCTCCCRDMVSPDVQFKNPEVFSALGLSIATADYIKTDLRQGSYTLLLEIG